jgi:hypothetical protein
MVQIDFFKASNTLDLIKAPESPSLWHLKTPVKLSSDAMVKCYATHKCSTFLAWFARVFSYSDRLHTCDNDHNYHRNQHMP